MLKKRYPWEENVLLKRIRQKRSSILDSAIHVVGHPSAPIGMGEHARSVFRALREAGQTVRLVDIYGPSATSDEQLIATYSDYISATLSDGVNIFCINGDEVEQAFGILESRNLLAKDSKNIIYPAWELSTYPAAWAEILNRFDEVWAPSQCIAEAIKPQVNVEVVHMPLACEIGERGLFSRSHFGIPDSSYCFLFAFDFLSYVERKNPLGVLEAFEIASSELPYADIRLVLKVNNCDRKPEAFKKFLDVFSTFRDKVILIEKSLSDLEMKALIWSCDCFVSLHRSEGFGRGMSEAMVLAKPVIATGYSGNMDFCSPDTAFLVPYELVPVGPDEYPFWQNQEWADPDPVAAAQFMATLVDDPTQGKAKGAAARSHMMAHFSFLRRGLDYAARCTALKEETMAT